MSLITRMRKMDAVYWAPGAPDAFGKKSLAAPVQIKCRWERRTEEKIDETGETRVENALVYVDRDVDLGGFLWLGLLVDAPSDPFADKLAYEILRFDKIPDIRVREFLRKAMV